MASTTTMTVTIAGITGKMGQLIAKHLLARPNVKVHGLCRTPSKLSASLTSNPRLSVFQSDANDTKGIHSALKGSDVAVCCYLGDVDVMIEGQKRLIDACISEKVPRYVASDWSMDFRKLKLGDHPLKDPMKHVQAYLEEKEASNQIKAVRILNACFLEIPWGGLWNGQTHKFQYWGTGEEKWELTSYNNAAEYTANVVMDPGASGWFSCKFPFLRQRSRRLKLCIDTQTDVDLQSVVTTRTSGVLPKTLRRSTSKSLRSRNLVAWTASTPRCIRRVMRSRTISGLGCRCSTATIPSMARPRCRSRLTMPDSPRSSLIPSGTTSPGHRWKG
jgi:putative NADH-flavin reductase